MPSDIEIAQQARMRPIEQIAQALAIPADALHPFGRYKAKIDVSALPDTGKRGKLVLVTAINPTPAGEGKTTTSIGLADGLRREGKKSVLALREPSLGPVFGVKGGAAGGGYSQVVPMEDINLHFTGDLHAITTANNLLAALLDNHIQQGNALGIDTRTITWRRCMDMNDRQLRQIISGLGGKGNGVPREDGFDITAASEVMAVFCLARDLSDLKARLARIVVGYTSAGEAVTAGDLNAQGAMAVLLREAFMPNLVQTLEGTPALIHGGPFANIAHGCNSVAATNLALRLGEYCVTEAGFGADLGAEKFLDIKCRMAGLKPDAAVLVATVRALKSHGGVTRAQLGKENVAALNAGLENLKKHVENLTGVFQLPCVVAINRFTSDTPAELEAIGQCCRELNVPVCLTTGWADGGAGAQELARAVISLCETHYTPAYAYPLEAPLEEKITLLATRIYGAKNIELAPGVKSQLKKYDALGSLPVCIAKTQYSLSDNPKKLARPSGHTLHIRSVRLSAGAGFVVAFAGEIIAMPGLPPVPAAEGIDILPDGTVVGIF